MKINVEDASGAVLDWLVAKVENLNPCEFYVDGGGPEILIGTLFYSPSTKPEQAQPIIDRKGIELYPDDAVMPKATYTPDPVGNPHYWFRRYGDTILIAAMRCHVASEIGESVDVPDRLVRAQKKTSSKYVRRGSEIFPSARSKKPIAKIFTGDEGHSLRILQGCPRMEVLQRIIDECPGFLKEYNIPENQYPKLFSV